MKGNKAIPVYPMVLPSRAWQRKEVVTGTVTLS